MCERRLLPYYYLEASKAMCSQPNAYYILMSKKYNERQCVNVDIQTELLFLSYSLFTGLSLISVVVFWIYSTITAVLLSRGK
jgi:hypothetical protein